MADAQWGEWAPDALDEDDGVQILGATYTGERVRGSVGTPSLQHERAIPLPLRVRSGAITPETLTLEGMALPWDSIQLVALGVVHHSLGNLEGPKTIMGQMFKKISKNEDSSSTRKAPQYSESMLLDIYGPPNEPPYRLDSVNLNYRSFLGRDVAMISFHNFYRLAVRLARGATKARINPALAALLRRRRDQIRPVAAVYDFELECQNDLNALEGLSLTTDLDLSRDNYTDEWENET